MLVYLYNMSFSVGQAVNVQEGGNTLSGTILRIGAMGLSDSVIVKFSDNSQKSLFWWSSR